MSPRIPTLSLKKIITPPPAFTPKLLSIEVEEVLHVVDSAPQQADAPRNVGTHAAAGLAADRDADDQVAHQAL